MTRLRGPYAHQIAVWRTLGEEEKALELLSALNTIQRVFGLPDYDMPEPYEDLPDLVTVQLERELTRSMEINEQRKCA